MIGGFCLEGSAAPTPCLPGNYCGTTGLSEVSGPCDAGYYCFAQNVSDPRPADGNGRGICWPGFYCGRGTTTPVPCPPGTFSPYKGLENITQCTPCLAGFFCPENNLTSSLSYPCNPGYYCPPGMSEGSPEIFKCLVGYHCSGGNAYPEPCPPGFYQDEDRKSTCKECIDGFYCPGTVAGVSQPIGTVYCTVGHYCLAGNLSVPISCPPGTFSNHTGKKQCDQCPGGYTCPDPATVQPLPCPEGRYCGDLNSGELLCSISEFCIWCALPCFALSPVNLYLFTKKV